MEVAPEIKQIDSCMSCPMRVDMSRSSFPPYSGICTHWGSPEGVRIPEETRKPPDWCPIRKRPLQLVVVS